MVVIEYDEQKVLSMDKKGLIDYEKGLCDLIIKLNTHQTNVKNKIHELSVAEYASKWPIKEGEKVKVTYTGWHCTNTEVLYFKRFGRNIYYTTDPTEVYGIFNTAKKDGSIGKRLRQIFSENIVSIEPCE